jgi:hypothetical protein
MVPKLGFVTIAYGDRGGRVEQEAIYVVTWYFCSHPWFGVINPFLP